MNYQSYIIQRAQYTDATFDSHEEYLEAMKDFTFDKCDPAIVNLVKKLNANGYKTHASCSGLLEEHPNTRHGNYGYISILLKDLDKEKINKIIKATQIAGMEYEIYDDEEELVPHIYIGVDDKELVHLRYQIRKEAQTRAMREMGYEGSSFDELRSSMIFENSEESQRWTEERNRWVDLVLKYEKELRKEQLSDYDERIKQNWKTFENAL